MPACQKILQGRACRRNWLASAESGLIMPDKKKQTFCKIHLDVASDLTRMVTVVADVQYVVPLVFMHPKPLGRF
jgi:hypothetical protein